MKNRKLTLLMLLVSIVLEASANPITKAEAREVAQAFATIDDMSSDDVPVAPYYTFSLGVGKGYVIVSGDDATTPIIGITEQGDFNYDELPDPLRDMLDGWAAKISRVQAMPKSEGPKRTPRERLETARRGVEAFKADWTDVPALCQTHWHQSSPYNDLAPTNPDNPSQRAVTGCVATAAAQIIYYFHKDNPAVLQYNTPTYTLDWGKDYGNYPVTTSLPKGTPVEYDLMKLSGSGNTKQNHAVAVLMYAIGTSSHLNYGPSTAGQPNEAGDAMRSQFLLDNEYVGKWNYGQQSWEKKIYNSLKAGSPMLYGGTHPDNGGHAVVLDGYQSRTGLYHFNFGWGGSGDGWFTVDDETGMNGYNADQRGCLNFKPQKQNLQATMDELPALYSQASNFIRVKIENNGTLDYTGINLYVNTSRNALPTTPSRKNTEVIPSGESRDIVFDYKPSTAKDAAWIFVTDAEKNILAAQEVTVLTSTPDIVLDKIDVNVGTTKTEVDGMTFGMVNSTTANVAATFTNGPEGTYCEPRLTSVLESYNVDEKQWVEVSKAYVRDQTFETGQTKTVTFTFPSLKEQTFYKAYIYEEVRAGSAYELKYNTDVREVFFTVRPSNFHVATDGRTVTVTGNWNASLFADRTGGADICSYDMTGVAELTEKPTVANPNALFYTSTPLSGATNVVYNGICDELVVASGYEFAPMAAFHAAKATMVLPVSEAGQWCDVLVPFAVSVPYGMQAKGITGVSTTMLSTEVLREVSAMTPALFIFDRNGMNRLTAADVDIATDLSATAAEGLLLASTVSVEMESRDMVLGQKNGAPFYLPVDEVGMLAPFQTVLKKYDKNGYRAIPVDETRYPDLAVAIAHAYEVKEANLAFATTEALEALDTVVKEAEDMFTFLTGEKASDIRNKTTEVEAAIEAFLNAVATGIETVDNTPAVRSKINAVYDLSGRKVMSTLPDSQTSRLLRKGIYIIGGRKVVVNGNH